MWYLGREESGIYLVEGSDCSMIISGGMSYITPDVLTQLKEFAIDETKIQKLLILHSHFDHVGLVPMFKKRLKDLTVYASHYAWETLQDIEEIHKINSFNTIEMQLLNVSFDLTRYDLLWGNDLDGITVSEGDSIDLGRFHIEILETPGHSKCSISAYIPQIKALFPSDSGGIPFKNSIITSGNWNYTEFQKSLRKLNSLDVDYLCADHYGYVTGPEAREFISETIQTSYQFCAMIKAVYRRAGSVEKTVKQMIKYTFGIHKEYFLSPDILQEVYSPMIRHIIFEMGI
jgi:glyoxylase-like metal-dependent hydrolase (beta-lactamase superfamily II)